MADILSVGQQYFLVIFVADVQYVRQQSAEINRLTEVVAVNADLAYMFLAKYFWLYTSLPIHFLSQQISHSEQHSKRVIINQHRKMAGVNNINMSMRDTSML